MRRTARTLLLTPLIALLALIGFAAAPAQAATWSSSDQWGTWTNGGYTLYNNIWGSGAGSQTIWANSYSDWGVWANHPDTGGIKSYPNAKKVVGRKVSAISTLTSTYNVTVPSSGAYNTSYDIWDTNYDYEIMLGSTRPVRSARSAPPRAMSPSAATPGASTRAATGPTRSSRSSAPRTPPPAPWTSSPS
ncbi:hypothetical protein Shyhy02_56830 [Streptomyces hygroscopicus subsp. hygroscopicus]|nr:hypothetical protein Shyhy02_56830 [Streptomyces hygroscopicus subsp. hygroscopicus]